MKKLLTLATTLALAASLSLSTAAATVNANNGQQDISVKAQYAGDFTEIDVISADITWGDMEFVYSASGNKVWQPADHSYSNNTASTSWAPIGNTVKVVNHSNIAMKATFTYTPKSGSTLTGFFAYNNGKTVDSTGAIVLTRGLVGQKDNADNVTATLTLAGTPDNTMTTLTQVGTVTVKLAK